MVDAYRPAVTSGARVDGPAKLTGAATYTADQPLAGVVHAALVGASIASGTVTRLDPSAAESAAGVLLVLTPTNRGALGALPDGTDWSGWPAETRPPLADDRIHYFGQYVAMVVAETPEQAQWAASLVRVDYQRAPLATAMDDSADTFRPEQVMGEPLQTERGETDAAFTAAPVQIDATYSSPNNHPCAMEPHATIAAWRDGVLTVHDSTQWVRGDQRVLGAAFDLPPEKVQVRAPFVGGMFGSKIATAAHTILAALAARRLGRPVKIVLTRQQVLTNVGHRSETVQRLRLGARWDGALVALRHDTRAHVAANEAGNPTEFHEPTSSMSRVLYAVPNYAATHEAVRLNVMAPAWMRAPGEATCQWALESAMDELASTLGMDPVELRQRNHADRDPHHDRAWSSKHLLDCYDAGARRFGWHRRPLIPRTLRDGDAFLGWGMATATYPGWRFGATVRVRLEANEHDVRALVSTSGSEVGNGAYTMLALTAADGLGLSVDQVRTELGDTSLPPSAQTGGSSLTTSTAPAVVDACRELRTALLRRAAGLDGFAGADARPDDFVFAGARVSPRAEPARAIPYAELIARGDGASLVAEASTSPVFLRDDQFAYQSFGAHFVEVRVDPDIGRIRVTRVVSVFDVGRVLNAVTTRSQLMGAIVFGIGQALHEDLTYDRTHGQPVNADLAGYLVPVNADVPDIDVSWIGAPDLQFNPIGCRGVGEIGITGVAAAIANAVHHATGIRVRSLPIGPDTLL
jgi:xanthine dehydrogenase YagR molybdenum-binding subunit